MRRQPRLVAVAALALLLVAGCGGDPKPKSLPSPTPSSESLGFGECVAAGDACSCEGRESTGAEAIAFAVLHRAS